jgi:hypothetical protein
VGRRLRGVGRSNGVRAGGGDELPAAAAGADRLLTRVLLPGLELFAAFTNEANHGDLTESGLTAIDLDEISG